MRLDFPQLLICHKCLIVSYTKAYYICALCCFLCTNTVTFARSSLKSTKQNIVHNPSVCVYCMCSKCTICLRTHIGMEYGHALLMRASFYLLFPHDLFFSFFEHSRDFLISAIACIHKYIYITSCYCTSGKHSHVPHTHHP